MAIGTAAAIIGSSVIGGIASSKAASAQKSAADAQAQVQWDMYNQTREDLSPYTEAGSTGLAAYMSELGLGDAPDGYTPYEMSTGEQWAYDQGMSAVNASTAATSGLLSGAAIQASNDYAQGTASQYRENYLNRLAGVADMGQASAAQQASNNSNAAAGLSQAYGNYGDAAASGYMGIANAANQGVGNYIGYQNYLSGLNTNNSSTLANGNYYGGLY